LVVTIFSEKIGEKNIPIKNKKISKNLISSVLHQYLIINLEKTFR